MVTNSWNLGCAAYCKDYKSPTYSKVKGRMLVCGANLLCQKYTIGFLRDLGGFTTTMKTRFMFALNVGQFTQIVTC